MAISPNTQQLLNMALDITAPKYIVEVQTREDGSVLWINVDGVCVLRICKIPELHVNGKSVV